MAWAIGASQPDDWAIGASQPTAAAPSGGQFITIIMSKNTSPLFLLPMYMWLKQDASTRRHFMRNTLASILGR